MATVHDARHDARRESLCHCRATGGSGDGRRNLDSTARAAARHDARDDDAGHEAGHAVGNDARHDASRQAD